MKSIVPLYYRLLLQICVLLIKVNYVLSLFEISCKTKQYKWYTKCMYLSIKVKYRFLPFALHISVLKLIMVMLISNQVQFIRSNSSSVKFFISTYSITVKWCLQEVKFRNYCFAKDIEIQLYLWYNSYFRACKYFVCLDNRLLCLIHI